MMENDVERGSMMTEPLQRSDSTGSETLSYGTLSQFRKRCCRKKINKEALGIENASYYQLYLGTLVQKAMFLFFLGAVFQLLSAAFFRLAKTTWSKSEQDIGKVCTAANYITNVVSGFVNMIGCYLFIHYFRPDRLMKSCFYDEGRSKVAKLSKHDTWPFKGIRLFYKRHFGTGMLLACNLQVIAQLILVAGSLFDLIYYYRNPQRLLDFSHTEVQASFILFGNFFGYIFMTVAFLFLAYTCYPENLEAGALVSFIDSIEHSKFLERCFEHDYFWKIARGYFLCVASTVAKTYRHEVRENIWETTKHLEKNYVDPDADDSGDEFYDAHEQTLAKQRLVWFSRQISSPNLFVGWLLVTAATLLFIVSTIPPFGTELLVWRDTASQIFELLQNLLNMIGAFYFLAFAFNEDSTLLEPLFFGIFKQQSSRAQRMSSHPTLDFINHPLNLASDLQIFNAPWLEVIDADNAETILSSMDSLLKLSYIEGGNWDFVPKEEYIDGTDDADAVIENYIDSRPQISIAKFTTTAGDITTDISTGTKPKEYFAMRVALKVNQCTPFTLACIFQSIEFRAEDPAVKSSNVLEKGTIKAMVQEDEPIDYFIKSKNRRTSNVGRMSLAPGKMRITMPGRLTVGMDEEVENKIVDATLKMKMARYSQMGFNLSSVGFEDALDDDDDNEKDTTIPIEYSVFEVKMRPQMAMPATITKTVCLTHESRDTGEFRIAELACHHTGESDGHLDLEAGIGRRISGSGRIFQAFMKDDKELEQYPLFMVKVSPCGDNVNGAPSGDSNRVSSYLEIVLATDTHDWMPDTVIVDELYTIAKEICEAFNGDEFTNSGNKAEVEKEILTEIFTEVVASSNMGACTWDYISRLPKMRKIYGPIMGSSFRQTVWAAARERNPPGEPQNVVSRISQSDHPLKLMTSTLESMLRAGASGSSYSPARDVSIALAFLKTDGWQQISGNSSLMKHRLIPHTFSCTTHVSAPHLGHKLHPFALALLLRSEEFKRESAELRKFDEIHKFSDECSVFYQREAAGKMFAARESMFASVIFDDDMSGHPRNKLEESQNLLLLEWGLETDVEGKPSLDSKKSVIETRPFTLWQISGRDGELDITLTMIADLGGILNNRWLKFAIEKGIEREIVKGLGELRDVLLSDEGTEGMEQVEAEVEREVFDGINAEMTPAQKFFFNHPESL